MARTRKNAVALTSNQRLGSVLKTCRDLMRKDKGLNGDLDRLPQLTWMMFLKFFDDLEELAEAEALLESRTYEPTIPSPYRWRDWVLGEDALTGQDLISFLNNDEALLPGGERGPGLFATLRRADTDATNDKAQVVSRIFSGITNRMINGYIIRDVSLKLSEINFKSSEDAHTLSGLYEGMLREMRDSAGDSGEFYTPRPVVRLMVRLTAPVLGERILDPACGTGGFLVETYEYLKLQVSRSDQEAALQRETLFGYEAKSLPYMLAEMNMLLHGITTPNVTLQNALARRIAEIGDSDRVDVILTNPPFGGEEEDAIKSNYPAHLQTAETALLFLQQIMRMLARPTSGHGLSGGRAAVVVPNGTLFGDGVSARVKALLLREFNLHTIVRLPKGVFAPYSDIATNLLFFDRAGPTEEIWYYEHPLPDGRKQYVKTKPVRYDEFEPLVGWWSNRTETARAWKVKAQDVLVYADDGTLKSCNLDVANPNDLDSSDNRTANEIVSSMLTRSKEIDQLLVEIGKLLG